MKEFILRGKIIDENNNPSIGIQVKAYDHHLAFLSDKNLGQTVTKSDGTFEIRFEESRIKQLGEFFERGPYIYLVIEYEDGKKILKTKVKTTQKEIEYHIKLVQDLQIPNAPDIYADNSSRVMAMLNSVGGLLNSERINLDLLAHGNLANDIRQRLQSMASNNDEAIKNFNSLQALISGVVSSTLQEYHLNAIEYDGPQVPRNSWLEGSHNVIIWPQKEEFKWE